MTTFMAKLKWFRNPALEGIVFAVTTLAVTNATIYFIYARSVEAVKEEIRDGLLRNVSAAAAIMDGDTHKKFTSKSFINEPSYIFFLKRMEALRKASSDVRYLYTNIIKNGEIYFVANGSPQNDNDNDGKPDPAPQLMDPYPDAGKALKDALLLKKPTVDREPYTDIWGTFYSAYAPFKDSSGQVVGTLGMDLELVKLDARLVPIGLAARRAAFTSGILSVLFGTAVWYFTSKNRQLEDGRQRDENRLREAQYVRDGDRTSFAMQMVAVADRLQKPSSSSLEYGAALHRYVQAKLRKAPEDGKNFDPISVIRQAMGNAIPLQVAGDVPKLLWGSGDRFGEMLNKLVFANSWLGVPDRAEVLVVNEALQRLDLVIELHHHNPVDKSLDNHDSCCQELLQDADHPVHVLNFENLTFATACEQLRAFGGEICYQDLGEDGARLILTLPFMKFIEA